MGARRCVLLLFGALAATLALVVAGCGSSSSGSGPSSPLVSEFSYLPADSPFVVTVATDPSSSAIQGLQDLIGRFPLAGLGLQALQSKLSQVGINYSSDVKPLLGNPVAVSIAGLPSGVSAANPDVVGAWVTRSASSLKALIKRAGVSSVGTRDGATLYQAGSTEIAVDGATLVFGTHGALASALDRHAHGGGGFSSAQYSSFTSGLPQDALVTAFGSLSGILSQPSAAAATRVPWIAAIRGYGAALSASSSGLSVKFRIDTTGKKLTASQLPIAPGTTAPAPAGPAPIEFAIHDPSQLATFGLGAAQSADPAGYQRLLGNIAELKSKLGVDVAGLAHQLTGDLSVASDISATVVRASVGDPAQFSAALSKLAHAPRSIVHKPIASLGNGFYAIREGNSTVTLGMVGNQFVAGKASPAQLRAFAGAKTNPVAGAQGSVAFRVALATLIKLALHQSIPSLAQPILNSLGDVTGWVSADPSGLTGDATLGVK
jgi:hypothetical protein